MALPYNSPYFRFLQRSAQDIKETGTLDGIKKRYADEVRKCPPAPARPLSMEKIFTLFLFVIAGFALACLVLMLECILGSGTRNLKAIDNFDANVEGLRLSLEDAKKSVSCVDIPGQDLLPERRRILMDLDRLVDITYHLQTLPL